MRTSLNEIKNIEDHLFLTAERGDTVLFEAKLLLQPGLKQNVSVQQMIYELIRQYSRKQLRAEIENVHKQFFEKPVHNDFATRIRRYFSAKP